MVTLAWQTIRTRPTSFAGTFIALTLGTALIAASGLVIATPQRGTDAQAYAESATLLALMAAISAFASIFVVAGTFALSINQRRRELALLRVVGATPRQTRRMLMAEAQLVGLAASVTGCVLALPVAHGALGFLRRLEVITPDMTIAVRPAPLVAALGIGLTVALLGVWFAARRTRRIKPVEALRQAAVEQKPMTISRWVMGVLATAGGVAMLGTMAGTGSEDRLALALLVGEVLVVGTAALAPVTIPPIVGLAGALLRRYATAEVAQANLRTQARRAASVAAPILLITGVAGSLLAATSSLERSVVNEERARTTADLVLVPSAAPGLSETVTQIASTVDGVATVAPIASTHVYAPDEFSTQVIPANAISSGALRFSVREGDMSALRGDSFAASHAFAADRKWRLGDVVPMRLEDGSDARLRLVATVDGGISGGFIFVPADRLQGRLQPWSTRYALVKLNPDARPGRGAAGVGRHRTYRHRPR
jgi:putative ABC transport system permease protein